MGNLIWHEYARYVAITASIYGIWSGFWGLFYRKFFWDFVGGVMRDPGGFQAPPSAAIFVTLIIRAPIIQIFTMIIAMFMVALDYPLPLFKALAIHRSLPLRVVVLVLQASFAILYYQGTNAAIWSLIAAGCYTRAIMLGETMAEAKENRGKGGRA